jgi:hypothetical protein
MVKSFKLAGAAAVAALLLGAASPAAARPGNWGHRGGGWHHRGGGGGVSFGDVVLGAVIVGGVAAVANNVANGSRNGDRDRGGDYDGSIDDRDRDRDGEGWNGDHYDNGAPRAGRAPASAEEDAAVDRCGRAASAQMGNGAEVRDIRLVDRDGAGWRVEGDVAESRGYEQSFVCGVRGDRVDFVQLNDRYTAR